MSISLDKSLSMTPFQNRKLSINNLFLCLLFLHQGCNDFSTFDCFESEDGCSANLEVSLEDYTADNLNDPWVLADTFPATDMADYRIDLGQSLDLGQSTDLNPPTDLNPLTDLNPPTDLNLPTDMTLDTDMAHPLDLGVNACNPNEVLPPCQSCINGEVQVNNTAGGCEVPNCSQLNSFRRETSPAGVEGCIQTVYSPREQLCEQGRCLQLEDSCIGEEQMVATVSLPECVDMTGCVDQQGVSLVVNEGEPCTNNNGTCNARGDCVPNNMMMISCPTLERSRLCSLSQANAQGCTYQVDLLLGWGWLSFASCNDFCAEYDGECTEAWDSRPICAKRTRRSCEQTGGMAICRCTFPP